MVTWNAIAVFLASKTKPQESLLLSSTTLKDKNFSSAEIC
jgi:hypothetical protein